MDFSESDMKRLKALRCFLAQSFKGASIGPLVIDDLNKSLNKAIKKLEQSK
jgi:hypothetical protein